MRLPAAILLVGVLFVAACGESGSKSVTPENTGWQNVAITDTDGVSLTIAELKGMPVLVENFATWCSNCRRQLGDTQAAAARAGDKATFLALSVETDLAASDVAKYAADNGFDDIRFAVMTPEMLAAMNDAYGNSALNPPSTPKITIAADGTAGSMVTGYESPDTILANLGVG
jgi:thiol-disulfide isomerase/thioredoxin